MPRLIPLLNFIFGATKLYFRNLLQWINSNAVGELTVHAPTTVNIEGGATANTSEQDLNVTVAGKGYGVKEGGAAAKAGRATLVAGTVTVNTTAITTSSYVVLNHQTVGGTPGWLQMSAKVAGTSFTILSSSVLDTSVVSWEIREPV